MTPYILQNVLLQSNPKIIMARTKQTARKCLVAQSIKRIRKPSRGGRKAVQSESEQEEQIVNNQQFSVKFDDQAQVEEHAVEAKTITCTNCQAIFTSQSRTLPLADYKKIEQDPNISDEKKQKMLKNLKNQDLVWICEFCLTHNIVPKNYNTPQTQNPCFLIQKSKKSKKGNQKEQSDDSEKILIFCIDISGSMDMQVLGTKTRLDTVKEAIVDEIKRMKFENEVIKVGLVTFGSLVTLIGDAKTFKEKNLDSQIYSNFNKIVQQCNKVKGFASPISKSFAPLKSRIQNLGTYGSTALGPGLLASIQIASKGAVGSKVIICTDGQANVGIGGLYGQNSPDFYQKAANFAKTKRVSVSILSLKGDKCNLKDLGKLSLASGGSILKIEPSSLGTQFQKIAKEQILGTSSQLVIKVNKIFQIVSHIPNELSPDRTTLTQQFGNFSSQTELTFEFKVLKKQEASLKPGVDLDLYNQTQVPMQVQLTYVGRNGNKYKQVITDWRQLTNDVNEIYDGANFGLFAASVLQRASAKIKAEEFGQAQKLIKGYWSIVNEKFSKSQTAEELAKFGDRVKKLESVLNSKQGKTGSQNDAIKPKTSIKVKGIARKSTPPKTGIRKIFKAQSMARSKSKQQSDDDLEENMSSDEQQQILWKEMRARSRSNSPQSKPQKKRK